MKDVFKIKTIQRIAGIIAFIAIVGFSMAACDDITKPETTKQTPVAGDYTFCNLNQTAGSVTAVTITRKSGKSTGAVSIKYAGSATIPQTAGTYAVTFDVAAASGWNPASGLVAGNLIVNPAGGNQTDNPQNPTAADFDIGNLTQTVGSVTAVTITPKSGKSGGVITVYYNGLTALPSAVGTYPVTFDIAATVGWNAATSLSAGTLVIAEPTPGESTPGKPTPGIDTTALDAVIQEAWNVRGGVKKASNASEVATGLWWVTESTWNAFDVVYKTAVETKVNPSSQSSVDTAKTNLQAALVTFNAAKKAGSGSAITLSGTITVKNNGQTVPYIMIQPHDDYWNWSETIKIPSSAVNTSWSIITKSFPGSTEISFDISGFDNDKYENALFSLTVDGLKKTVHNTDVNNITINLDLNFITISGTLNLNYGKVIPSVRIDIYRKDELVRLGSADILNVANNAPWSTIIPSQTVDTDITFDIVGFVGPVTYEYDQLFALWREDFSVKVGNQNKSGVVLNLITISGTFNFDYNGKIIPSVEINISRKDDDLRLGNGNFFNAGNNTPWSIVIPVQNVDTDVTFNIVGFDGPTLWSDELLFALWFQDFGVKVGNQNKSGIALNLITVSGTINVTYNESPPFFVAIQISKKVNDDDYIWIASTNLYNPSANAPWSIIIPAFTSNTEVHVDVGVGDSEDDLIWIPGPTATRTVKDSSVSGIVLNMGNITD